MSPLTKNEIAEALLDVLGPEGTLAVPNFTFSLNHDNGPIFDPANDPSEMGQISEAARVRPGALRSHHMMHSVGAIGPHAAEITSHHGASAFAGDSPFWKVYELGGRIMLLGVPYLRSTFFHVIEQLVQVTYRGPRRLVEERIRDEDGTIRPLLTQKSTRLPNATENDFNKFGSLLEERGLVPGAGGGERSGTPIQRPRRHGDRPHRVPPGPSDLRHDRRRRHAPERRGAGKYPQKVCKQSGGVPSV